jgi:hypothetical protein
VVNGPGPGRRCYSTTTVVGSKLFVFGGWNDDDIYFNDMWTLDLNCRTWPIAAPSHFDPIFPQ